MKRRNFFKIAVAGLAAAISGKLLAEEQKTEVPDFGFPGQGGFVYQPAYNPLRDYAVVEFHNALGYAIGLITVHCERKYGIAGVNVPAGPEGTTGRRVYIPEMRMEHVNVDGGTLPGPIDHYAIWADDPRFGVTATVAPGNESVMKLFTFPEPYLLASTRFRVQQCRIERDIAGYRHQTGCDGGA